MHTVNLSDFCVVDKVVHMGAVNNGHKIRHVLIRVAYNNKQVRKKV